MSAFDFMRARCPWLSDEDIVTALARAEGSRAAEALRWQRQQWRRVHARASVAPHLAGMRSAYRARRR
jgi:hypothetical protein